MHTIFTKSIRMREPVKAKRTGSCSHSRRLPLHLPGTPGVVRGERLAPCPPLSSGSSHGGGLRLSTPRKATIIRVATATGAAASTIRVSPTLEFGPLRPPIVAVQVRENVAPAETMVRRATPNHMAALAPLLPGASISCVRAGTERPTSLGARVVVIEPLRQTASSITSSAPPSAGSPCRTKGRPSAFGWYGYSNGTPFRRAGRDRHRDEDRA
jgi:hypothetical protein